MSSQTASVCMATNLGSYDWGISKMTDDKVLKTVGEKAQAIHDAIKAEENCMVFVPYPIGWLAGVSVDQLRISVDRLDDVEVKRTSITDTLSFEVKKNDE